MFSVQRMSWLCGDVDGHGGKFCTPRLLIHLWSYTLFRGTENSPPVDKIINTKVIKNQSQFSIASPSIAFSN